MGDDALMLAQDFTNVKVVMDSREKMSHVKEYCEEHGIPVVRRKLDYGDYGIEVDGVLQPFTVERKNSLDELGGNFLRRNQPRFRREFERSQGKMAVVCEGDFNGIAERRYSRCPLHPRFYLAAIKKFTKEYGVEFHFIPTDSAQFIVELLRAEVAC
jgi:ERCC4-type nuclease